MRDLKRRYFLALAVSLGMHAVILIGIIFWSLHNVILHAGKTGVVELSLFEGGKGNSKDDNSAGAKKLDSQISAKRSLMNILNKEPAVENDSGDDNQEKLRSEGEGVSGDGTGSVSEGDPRLLAIWKKINRAKYYPELARRQGLEGIPKVTFVITEDGRVKNISVAKTCGIQMLDDAAIEAIQKSAPLPFYPNPITIAVRYSLKENR